MIRLISGILAAVFVPIATATIASAGASDQEKFAKAVGKFAPPFAVAFDLNGPLKTKTLCVCTDAPRKPGFLYRDQDESLRCAIPVFLPDGSFADVASICDHYEILSK